MRMRTTAAARISVAVMCSFVAQQAERYGRWARTQQQSHQWLDAPRKHPIDLASKVTIVSETLEKKGAIVNGPLESGEN